MLATQKELSKARANLEKAYSAYPFYTQDILDKEGEVEALENGLKRMSELEETLFPTAGKVERAQKQSV